MVASVAGRRCVGAMLLLCSREVRTAGAGGLWTRIPGKVHLRDDVLYIRVEVRRQLYGHAFHGRSRARASATQDAGWYSKVVRENKHLSIKFRL